MIDDDGPPPSSSDPNRSIEDILKDIEGSMHKGLKHARYVGFVLPPFAALLVRLSRDAAKSAKIVSRLTWAIFALTGILVILTIVLVWFTWKLLAQEPPNRPHDAKLSCETAQQHPCYK